MMNQLDPQTDTIILLEAIQNHIDGYGLAAIVDSLTEKYLLNAEDIQHIIRELWDLDIH